MTQDYQPVTDITHEEFLAQLEEHDRQIRRQVLFKQMRKISMLPTYQTVRYRCLQRVGLRPMMLWLLVHGQPMAEAPRRAGRAELAF